MTDLEHARDIYADLMILFTSGGHSLTEEQLDEYAVGIIANHLKRIREEYEEGALPW